MRVQEREHRQWLARNQMMVDDDDIHATGAQFGECLVVGRAAITSDHQTRMPSLDTQKCLLRQPVASFEATRESSRYFGAKRARPSARMAVDVMPSQS